MSIKSILRIITLGFVGLHFQSSISFAQEIDRYLLNLEKHGENLKLEQDQPGEPQFLIVEKYKSESVKKIALEEEYDPYSFRDLYIGERSFAIIGGRYKFYIFNISTDRLIGPLQITPKEGSVFEDAQSGVNYAYSILHNGQYLLVYALDLGLFCFSLQDLYIPVEISELISDTKNSIWTQVFFEARGEGIYNVIVAACKNYQKEIELIRLLPGYRLRTNQDNSLWYKASDDNVILIESIRDSTDIRAIKIDLEEGVVSIGKY